jgi:hypothetical protein
VPPEGNDLSYRFLRVMSSLVDSINFSCSLQHVWARE